MADNYLEYAREDYERRKARLALHKKQAIYGSRLAASPQSRIERPDDEAL